MMRTITILIISVLIFSGCEHKDYFVENNGKPEITVSIDGVNYSKSINDSIKAGFSQLRAYYKVSDDNYQYSIKIDYSGLNVSENEIDRSIIIDSDSVIDCTIKIIVVDQEVARGYSVVVALPTQWKLSTMFPDFKLLDQLTLPNAYLALSSFDYKNQELNASLRMGLNFISNLEAAPA